MALFWFMTCYFFHKFCGFLHLSNPSRLKLRKLTHNVNHPIMKKLDHFLKKLDRHKYPFIDGIYYLFIIVFIFILFVFFK